VYLLFAAYYFFETASAGRPGYARAFAAVNAVFVLIVLAQALPTMEFIMQSKRVAPGGMGYEVNVDQQPCLFRHDSGGHHRLSGKSSHRV